MKMFGVYEFMPSNEMMANGGKYVCKDESLFQEVCANVLFLIAGFNSQQLNRTIMPTILENTPAGKINYSIRVFTMKLMIANFQEHLSIKLYIMHKESILENSECLIMV